MKLKSITFFILGVIPLLSLGYIGAKTISTNQPKPIVLPGYKMVYVLKDKRGLELGEVFIKDIKNGVFKHLRILKNGRGIDTLYSIDNLKLKNPKGIDIQVGGDEFYGYKIILTKGDYIVLTIVNRKGDGISDNITINWNYESKLFEVLKTP